MDAEELAGMILKNKASTDEVSDAVNDVVDQAGDCRQDRDAAAEDLTVVAQACYVWANRLGDYCGWEWERLADKIERVIHVLRLPPRPKSPAVFSYSYGQRRLDDFLLRRPELTARQPDPEQEPEEDAEPEDDLLAGM